MSLIYLSSAWLLGIFAGSWVDVPFWVIFAGLVPLAGLFFRALNRKAIILLSLCLIALAGGALQYQATRPVLGESHLLSYNGRAVEIKGMVAAAPDSGDKTTHLRLAATGIRIGGEWRTVSGTALIYAPVYARYSYGDTLSVSGRLDTPGQLDAFDYQGYLARQGVYSTMAQPTIEVLETGRGFQPIAWLYSLRDRLAQVMAAVLPEPEASLAQGIILGVRSHIPAAVSDAFSITGTSHILAISGVNITIVAGGLLSLGIWLFGRRRRIYIWLAFTLVWLYTLLAGAQPPVVRGAIMASLFFAAEMLGRQRNGLTSLAFAAAVMAGINPNLLWDASFQLSFMAMAGLVFLSPAFIRLGRRGVKAVLGEENAAARFACVITDSFSVTVSAIIAVWPLVAHYFGIFSLVGLPATLLALPALPAIIVSGAAAGVTGLFFMPLAQVIAWIAWLFLAYLWLVVTVFAAIPQAAIQIGVVSPGIIAVYYAGLAAVGWGVWRRDLVKRIFNASGDFISRLPLKYAIPPLLLIALLVWTAVFSMPDDKVHISFFDVGEGDSALIRTPHQQDILVDGGPGGQAVSLGLSRAMPFFDRTIEMVVLTHPHADHLTGLLEVLQRYNVKQVLLPDVSDNSTLYREWLSRLSEKNIKTTLARTGQQIGLSDGSFIEVVSAPTVGQPSPDADNDGIVLRLITGKVSVLMTADVGQATESKLIGGREVGASTVLKVAHHGSNTSTSPEFLAVVKPRAAIISVGADNKFGHPTPEVMSRLTSMQDMNVFRTDKQGTVEFTTDGERLWVKTEK